MLYIPFRRPLLLVLSAYLLSLALIPHAFAATTATFTPSQIPLSSPEIVNPLRGYIKWGGGSETVPVGEPAKDWTNRISWSDIEKSQGVYDWSITDQLLEKAASEGRRMSLAFRDMRDYGMFFPAYLKPYSWTTINEQTGDQIVVPDYNNSFYQSRMRAFLMAAGARYDGKLAFVDIRMYGKWGEWHLYSIDYSKAPSGITPATQASKRAIVDAHIAAFPKTQLVSMINDSYALKYALMDTSPTYPIGWRADSFGRDTFLQNALAGKLDDYPGLADVFNARWKVAPVVAELYGSGVSAESLLPQVSQYHVSVIGNGNFGDAWVNASSSQQAMFHEAGKRSGYRYVIRQATADTSVAGKLTISAQWLNEGVGPAYEPWQVRWQLRNPSTNAVVWEGVSQLNLKTLLPTAGTPVTVSDTFSLPSTVAAGTYRLMALVSDPRTIRKPLRLAISGKQTDNSFLLGDLTLSAASPTPTPTPQPAVITVRGSSSASADEGRELLINKPANMVAGDVLVAQVSIRDAGAAVTAPSGWTQVRADTVTGKMKQLIYYRVASSSEPTSYAWQYTSPQASTGVSDSSGGIVAYSNVDRTNPIAAHSGQANSPSTSITAPSLTTTSAGNMLVFLGSIAWRDASLTSPQGMAQRFDQGVSTVGSTALGSDQMLTAAGATGARTAVAAGSDYSIGQLVALRPAGSSTATQASGSYYLPVASASGNP